jgi:hypothetical protein
MKNKPKSNFNLMVFNILLSVVILFLVYNYSKSKNTELILEKLIKIENRLDEQLIPSTRIKKKRSKKKKVEWRK